MKCIPESVLQRRALREASEVLANALREGAKERAASKCRDRDVGRNGPPATSRVLVLSFKCCTIGMSSMYAWPYRTVDSILQGSTRGRSLTQGIPALVQWAAC